MKNEIFSCLFVPRFLDVIRCIGNNAFSSGNMYPVILRKESNKSQFKQLIITWIKLHNMIKRKKRLSVKLKNRKGKKWGISNLGICLEYRAIQGNIAETF